MNDTIKNKIILPGGAGLVGQNLIPKLQAAGYQEIVVIDKHRHNLNVAKATHKNITTVLADLAQPGEWQVHFEGADAVVILQAQIGGKYYDEFVANNVTSTELIIDTIKRNNIKNTVHISSSVVNSVADDFYTRSKTAQEELVLSSELNCPILRPTLMFGWFDRKHLGWLKRFMHSVPVFPIPGNGKYMRQPLYVGDFCNVIVSCLLNKIPAKTYDITGLEKIDYIDIIKAIKSVTNARALILKIPYGVFRLLLDTWSLFDKTPPFTSQQLAALVAPDEFDVIDWPGIFNIKATPIEEALHETFNHPIYSQVEMEF